MPCRKCVVCMQSDAAPAMLCVCRTGERQRWLWDWVAVIFGRCGSVCARARCGLFSQRKSARCLFALWLDALYAFHMYPLIIYWPSPWSGRRRRCRSRELYLENVTASNPIPVGWCLVGLLGWYAWLYLDDVAMLRRCERSREHDYADNLRMHRRRRDIKCVFCLVIKPQLNPYTYTMVYDMFFVCVLLLGIYFEHMY